MQDILELTKNNLTEVLKRKNNKLQQDLENEDYIPEEKEIKSIIKLVESIQKIDKELQKPPSESKEIKNDNLLDSINFVNEREKENITEYCLWLKKKEAFHNKIKEMEKMGQKTDEFYLKYMDLSKTDYFDPNTESVYNLRL